MRPNWFAPQQGQLPFQLGCSSAWRWCSGSALTWARSRQVRQPYLVAYSKSRAVSCSRGRQRPSKAVPQSVQTTAHCRRDLTSKPTLLPTDNHSFHLALRQVDGYVDELSLPPSAALPEWAIGGSPAARQLRSRRVPCLAHVGLRYRQADLIAHFDSSLSVDVDSCLTRQATRSIGLRLPMPFSQLCRRTLHVTFCRV